MRKLVTIQTIKSVEPIKGADRIVLYKMHKVDWQVVGQKDAFKVHDKILFYEIDSLLPIRPEFEFLRKSSYKKWEGVEGFRLRTIKLKNTLSQGLITDLSVLPDETPMDDRDYSEILGVLKWEAPEIKSCSGVKYVGGGRVRTRNWPSFISKTDETRIQTCGGVIDELWGKPFYISVKADGSSGTFYIKDGKFGVCSRNMERSWEKTKWNKFKSWVRKILDLPTPKGSEQYPDAFWHVACKYNIENALRAYGGNIAVQGEVVGPGIQDNPMGLEDHEIRLFNMFDIDNCKYLDYSKLLYFGATNNIPGVETVTFGDSFNYTAKDLLELASKIKYPNGKPAEGIVIRPTIETYSHTLKGRLSFKAISNVYLLNEKL